jgi:hypothetical protein
MTEGSWPLTLDNSSHPDLTLLGEPTLSYPASTINIANCCVYFTPVSVTFSRLIILGISRLFISVYVLQLHFIRQKVTAKIFYISHSAGHRIFRYGFQHKKRLNASLNTFEFLFMLKSNNIYYLFYK